MKSRLQLAEALSRGQLSGADKAYAEANPVIRAEADRLRAEREGTPPASARKLSAGRKSTISGRG